MVVDAIWIDTKIVFEPGKKLAFAYNRAMECTTAEWVLFLDQDLFVCNPHWYSMCLNAIKEVGDGAGWITAKCNRIGNSVQLHHPPNDSDNVLDHIKIAKQLYHNYGSKVVPTSSTLSGFFILTSKSAWKAVGGFRSMGKGLSGVDKDYCRRLRAAGFKSYVMPGLYFYHLYKVGKRKVFRGF